MRGTGKGVVTDLVLTQANSQDFFDLKVKEILCKPHFWFWQYDSLMALGNAR